MDEERHMAESIDFTTGGAKRIGLIVRGKLGPDHHPDKMAQHADCILANGAPTGFFGEGNDQSGNAIGLRMAGIVYDYAKLQINRPYYVDKDQAVTARVVSTVLLIDVDQTTADLFAKAWSDMTLHPGDFNIVGGNCASHASAAFIKAKIVSSSIPWLDTPDNLYGQLVEKVPAGKRRSITGFFGFTPKGGGYVMTWEPYTDSPKANRPNPGKSGSSSSN
jgi:hypothetical protein